MVLNLSESGAGVNHPSLKLLPRARPGLRARLPALPDRCSRSLALRHRPPRTDSIEPIGKQRTCEVLQQEAARQGVNRFARRHMRNAVGFVILDHEPRCQRRIT